ncbi:MAG: DUF2807 domain-containing protein [Bacteroidales bacterium]|nr:DUF2807 domain-containing protein [Bacteroidales bacterium]
MKVKIIVALISFISCFNVFSLNVLAEEKETRKVDNFSTIDLSIPAKMYLEQGSENKLIIESDKDVLDEIETFTKGDELVIRFKKRYKCRGKKSINIFLTAKDVNELKLFGSGNITVASTMKADEMSLYVSGSGSIQFKNLVTSKVLANLLGSGSINLQGKQKSSSLDAAITGSGRINTLDMNFDEVDLKIIGSGTIKAKAETDLDVKIVGSGSVYYDGDPLIDANVVGSGRVRRN